MQTRRALHRPVALLALCLLLAACAARGALDLVPGATAPGAAVQTVFVASNRKPAAQGTFGLFDQDFGETRDATLRFARVDISIPPVHRAGVIEWPHSEPPDAENHFVARKEKRYDGATGFLRDLDRAAPRGAQEVLLFVHGFNVNNAEAVYRLAQIAHDFDAQIPAVAYSWPSAGSPRGYAYDRDSVIFSRDGLESLLTELTGQGRRVLIVAHSMGSQLVMEVLRQMSISGQGHILRQVSGVALISPDIDEDVFRRQASRIAPFPQPFMLMVSSRDRALNLSAYLTGKPSRLGSIRDPERLSDLPVEVIDLSNIRGGDRSGHSTAFTAPAAIEILRDLSTGG
ncbi:alpha/beta hydrolase [Pseudoponticoccus marisrubri]|uniref:Esterase n=1 Tax=Pseudoponticoccus marisrubri TaxID=1685382 RepID=A0A0W7WE83_9RHOB|nr:alpha/beta fold hydrolase [Pseudoponticoccus marisrubri]KUF08886.1 hypothetical protein AVJ23_20580 [Pseudoponticoccus marisrubri]